MRPFDNSGRDEEKVDPQSAETLWRYFRRTEKDSSSNKIDTRTLGDLAEVSDAFRDMIQRERERDVVASQTAFAAVHERLMDDIERSRYESEMPPEMTRPPRTLARKAARKFASANSYFAKPRIAFRSSRLALVAVACCLLIAVGFGDQQWDEQGTARALPAQVLIDDFDAGLRAARPVEWISDDAGTTAHWINKKTGVKANLPVPHQTGLKLVGARHQELHGHPMVQTHYLKDGARVALYQIRAPRYGFADLDEVNLNGKSFFAKDYGKYRLVVWRADDNVMAVVSPLAMRDSLKLSSAMRAAPLTPGAA